MTINPTLRCPCKEKDLSETFVYSKRPEGETSFDLSGQEYLRSYQRCEICHHWFGVHDIDLSSLYECDYVDATYGGLEGMANKLKKILSLPKGKSDNLERVERINQNVMTAAGMRLLDVGAGLGVFPYEMKAAGWDVVALEPDQRTVEHLKQMVGVTGICDDLLNLSKDQIGLFDLITFNKVLEHVEDPVKLLEHASQLLKPNAQIYIELPDVAAEKDGHGREEFFIEHHHVFSPASLAILIQNTKLYLKSLERIVEPSGKYTVYAFCSLSPTR